MDLTVLNRSPLGAAARAVGQVTYGAVTAAGGVLGAIRWRTGTAWQLLLSRTRFDYRAEVGDPLTNSAVGAVTGWIARNFPEAPVRIVREGTTEIAYTPSSTGPGYMLRLLERPNPYYDGVLQWMATILDFLRGDAYWLKRRDPRFNRVRELWWLPRWMVEPRWDPRRPTTFITHYEYTVDGVAYKIEPRNIVHFRRGISPSNPRKGVDVFESLFREILTDDEASNFTASLLRNLGVPGVIIAPANTTGAATLADPEGIKKKYQETFGGDNRGAAMVMTKPTEVKILSWSPEAMNLTKIRRIPEERISAGLGVPAGVAQLGAGLDRNTFTNYGEARGAAYTEGVIPLQRLIAATLEIQLLTEFADLEREPLDVWFDWTQVAAMQAVVLSAMRAYESAATKGLLTRADFKRAVHMPVNGNDDVFVMPNNYLVVPAGGNGSPPPPGRAAQAFVEGPQLLTGGRTPLLEGQANRIDVHCSGCERIVAKVDPEAPSDLVEVKCPKCGTLNVA